MMYSFDCPQGDFTATVEAENDDEAIEKLIMQGKEHGSQAHPGMVVNDEDMMEMVRSQMKKG